ncbi:hypothetical protein CLV32_0404 [Pedobacter duraquae]|uniref:Aminoacetone oxidase family FAD-binding enzyme n=2 Tax=Pedobacter duraquae TaxID=425511 RepID=A0A4R6IPK4_9SPHI|nr:hypothetical protein CLV32_0404 [Pedobacter duraquae]
MDVDAIIIGAGACGLMCAVQAGFLGKRVILLEKGAKAGAKILISGGGRCNYTNLYSTDEQFISNNKHFVKSAFKQWSVSDTISFFETYGVFGKEKTLGQLFPDGKDARDIVAIFTGLCDELGQNLICKANVLDVVPIPDGFEVEYETNDVRNIITASKVVVATGGLPIPKMGATDFALKLARRYGLELTDTAPALVPLTITGKDEEWYAQLSGNTVFCEVSNDHISFEENLLFTHWGLSGPSILQISSFWRPGQTITINLLPHQDIAVIIEEERRSNGKILLSTLLSRFYTRKFTDAMGKFLPLDKQIANLTKVDIDSVHKILHEFTVKPAGDKGYDKAEVMRGGIDTDELSSKTLECKKIPGMFFGGECVDVTGWLGGYNFQWAWASGFVIAQHI